MSNNKQSSLEWYAEKEHEIAREFVLANINHREYFDKKRELLEQAKAMHKEEIMDANFYGQRLHAKSVTNTMMEDNAEQYYNETFGGNNEQQ